MAAPPTDRFERDISVDYLGVDPNVGDPKKSAVGIGQKPIGTFAVGLSEENSFEWTRQNLISL